MNRFFDDYGSRPEPRGNQPRVRMSQTVWEKLWGYIHACQWEVGGLGSVVYRNNVAEVRDVFLFDQKVSAASTNLRPADVRDFQLKWIEEGKDPEQLKFWWHSHAEFPVGWSPTDEKTIDLLTAKHLFVTFVGNHRGDSRVRITTAAPERLSFDELPLEIVPEISPRIAELTRKEVEQKVQYSLAGGIRRSIGDWRT